MVSIREIREINIRDKYKEKLELLKLAPTMINIRTNTYSLNFTKIIKKVNSKIELDSILIDELMASKGKGFYDYSILMGMHYGIYNLYCYNDLSSKVVDNIIEIGPSPKKTKKIFYLYNEEITSFLKEKHSIEVNEINDMIEKMFTIINDYSLYNKDIVKDINKILLAIEIRYSNDLIEAKEKEISKSIKTGEIMEYYDKINNGIMDIKKIIPRK